MPGGKLWQGKFNAIQRQTSSRDAWSTSQRELLLSAARDDCWGVLPPSSYHQGGVNVAMVDGAVRFVGEEIDAGNEHVPTVYLDSPTPPGSRSPFGVWGAMGTRASSELNR